MALNFTGKTILITGSSMGIGKGLSRCFAQEGANIVLADLPGERSRLEAWAQELKERYGIMTWTCCVDLTEPDGPQRLYDQATGLAGGIHTLVNNAGMCWFGNFIDMPPERIEAMLLLNCLAYAKLSRLFLPAMLERDSGAILNLSSISAFQPVPKMAVYAASKAFTQSISEAVRAELPLGSNVVVSTLNPPFTRTSLIDKAGVPTDFVPLLSSFMKVEDVVETGFKAFQKGKARYVPGLINKVLYLFVVKYVPAAVLRPLTWLICNRLGDIIPAPVMNLFYKIRNQGGQEYV